MLQDTFDRSIDYVRVAVTDRCNLRCFYCMPKQGIPYEPKAHLLSYEEITRVLKVLAGLGFKKVRFTGGEPFLRKDFMHLLENTADLGNYKSINITTNGTLIKNQLPRLKELGITNINLSLDSLDPYRFHKITRRNDFDKVMQTFHALLSHGFNVKINAVVMHGVNTEDIIALANLAKHYPVAVRFIEEMPFNGFYKNLDKRFTAKAIYEELRASFPTIQSKPMKDGQTANRLAVKGFAGELGIIAAFSRTFCNTCNRLRITAKGSIKSCLYDGGVFNLRDYLRSGVDDLAIAEKFSELVRLKPKDGFVAERQKLEKAGSRESMSTIGG